MNIWNFSDMQVSIVFYGGLLALSVASSFIIFVFSVSLKYFVTAHVIIRTC